jgi:hypothetical protein
MTLSSIVPRTFIGFLLLTASVCAQSAYRAPADHFSFSPVFEAIDQTFSVALAQQQQQQAQTRGEAPNAPPMQGDSAYLDHKWQALERACKVGVFTPEECAAKRTALKSEAPPQGSSAPPADSNGGSVYSEPHGAFRLVIPQGWEAKPQTGCYGPKENCPPNAGGVNIGQGSSWAFIAPFSASVRRPTDIVEVVAGQYQSQYRNLKMIQNEPQKFGDLDIALGQFTAVDQRGVTVSLVVIGIAAPNRAFYVACSSVDLSDASTVGPALSSMLQSLQFAGE